MWDESLAATMVSLANEGNLRQLKTYDGMQDVTLTIEGKTYLNFCSNNYLGLANHPVMIEAGTQALKRYGLGAGASRLVCGNNREHELLESEMAVLKDVQAALVFNSGFSANTSIIPALVGRDDVVFADRLNHASIIDGIILSRATLKRYQHADMQHLKKLLATTNTKGRKLIVTDSVFSMDGDKAPLVDIVQLANQYGAEVMVDEAHALGVLGHQGAGLVEELQLSKKIGVQMGTFSKALGVMGAYVACSSLMRQYLINHARGFIYTTAMPPAICASIRTGLQIMMQDQQRRLQLRAHAAYVRESLQAMGFKILGDQTPIIPIVVGDNQKALQLSQALYERGILISAIRPPTVPVNTARLRLTVMATHTREQLKYLIDTLKEIS